MKKSKLLLDENIGTRVAVALRASGYDVVSIIEDAPGLTDVHVLKRARRENRIVVTLDRDFGALVFRDSQPHVGVIFLRLQKESVENITFVLESVLQKHADKLKKKFTTASETDVRIR